MLHRITFMLVMVFLLGTGIVQAQSTLPLPLPRATVELLTNGDFETDADGDKIPDGWSAQNTKATKKDKLKCNKVDAPVAHDGACAFMFRGNPNGVVSKLKQNITDFTPLIDGVTLQFSAYLDARSATPAATFAKVKVKLSNNSKIILKLSVPETSNRGVDDYALVSATAPLVLNGATITKVNIQVMTKETGGKFLVDDVSLTVESDDTPAGEMLAKAEGGANEYFGYHLAVSNSFLAVGVPGTDNATGEVFVYKRTGDTLSEPQIVVGDDIAPNSFFGGAIALNDWLMVVGAPSSFGINGVAYVFIYNGSTWEQVQKLISSDGVGTGAFGYSVALDNELILVGAPVNNAAYVFKHNGTEWVEDQKLTSPLTQDLTFGRSVDLFGNTALIGSEGDAEGKGAAYIFQYENDDWVEKQQLLASDGSLGDKFGYSVALGNNVAVVGAPGEFGESVRAAYTFTLNGSTWTQQQKLLPPNANNSNRYGYDVDISGNTILVGAPAINTAYTWEFDGTTWQREYTLEAPEGIVGDFGLAVALYGNTALVGAPYHTLDDYPNQGSAWLYKLP